MRELLDRRTRQRLTWRELSAWSRIPVSTLQFWSKRLRTTPRAESRAARSAFVELAIAPTSVASAALEIALENGRRLRVAPDSDERMVLRWVRILEATC